MAHGGDPLMGCFVDSRLPVTGLTADGLIWGGTLGALITLPLFPVGFLVGGVVGVLVGLVAGLAFMVGSWLRCRRTDLAAGTLVLTLAITYGAVHWLFLEDDPGELVDPFAAFVVGLAALPLGVDVVMRARGHFRQGDRS